jgi:hypothetical protein
MQSMPATLPMAVIQAGVAVAGNVADIDCINKGLLASRNRPWTLVILNLNA